MRQNSELFKFVLRHDISGIQIWNIIQKSDKLKVGIILLQDNNLEFLFIEGIVFNRQELRDLSNVMTEEENTQYFRRIKGAMPGWIQQ